MNATRILAEGTLRPYGGDPIRVFVIDWTGTAWDQSHATVVLLESGKVNGDGRPPSPAGTLVDVLATDEGDTFLKVDPTTFVGAPRATCPPHDYAPLRTDVPFPKLYCRRCSQTVTT